MRAHPVSLLACFVLSACAADPGLARTVSAARHEATAKGAESDAAYQPLDVEACVGLTSAERDTTPFAHREDIASVRPLLTRAGGGKSGLSSRMTGAVVVVRATRGMTAQWLRRVIDCHVARDFALGRDVGETPAYPLVPNGIKASVEPAETGFAVAIRSDDSAVAQEVLRRAQRLIGP